MLPVSLISAVQTALIFLTNYVGARLITNHTITFKGLDLFSNLVVKILVLRTLLKNAGRFNRG